MYVYVFVRIHTGSGSDAGALKTVATVDPSNPNYYIVNGNKAFISGAGKCVKVLKVLKAVKK